MGNNNNYRRNCGVYYYTYNIAVLEISTNVFLDEYKTLKILYNINRYAPGDIIICAYAFGVIVAECTYIYYYNMNKLLSFLVTISGTTVGFVD